MSPLVGALAAYCGADAGEQCTIEVCDPSQTSNGSQDVPGVSS
jgi:hypothetical protein